MHAVIHELLMELRVESLGPMIKMEPENAEISSFSSSNENKS